MTEKDKIIKHMIDMVSKQLDKTYQQSKYPSRVKASPEVFEKIKKDYNLIGNNEIILNGVIIEKEA